MLCRHCGTEIADKALICYRCGAATTDPIYKPPSAGRPRLVAGDDDRDDRHARPARRHRALHGARRGRRDAALRDLGRRRRGARRRHRPRRRPPAPLSRAPAGVIHSNLMPTDTSALPAIRHDWTVAEIEAIYTAPFADLIVRAQSVHRAHHRADEVQGCMLLSIKTGGCPEDCAYCPQSAHYSTGVERHELMSVDETLEAARRRARAGRDALLHGRGLARRRRRRRSSTACSRWCAASARSGMEACCTLGMLTDDAGGRAGGGRADARTTTTSTRRPSSTAASSPRATYEERLDTLARVRAGRHHGLLRRHHRHGRGPPRHATGCCSSWRRSIRIRRACR